MVWFHSCSYFCTPFILSWFVNFWFESQKPRWMDWKKRHLDKRSSISGRHCYWQCPSFPLQYRHNIPSVLHVKKVFKIPEIPVFKSLVWTIMVISVVEFPRDGYKISKIFCKKSIFKKEWYFVTKIVLTYCEKKMF